MAEINNGQISITEEPFLHYFVSIVAYNGCDSGSNKEGDDIAEEVNPTLFLEEMTIAIGALTSGAATIVGSDADGGCSQNYRGGAASSAATGCSSNCRGAAAWGKGHAALSSRASSAGGQSPRTAGAHGSGIAGNGARGDFLHSISIGSPNRLASAEANFRSLLQLSAFHEKTT